MRAEVAAFVESLRSRRCFESAAPVIVTRAPGRLDVMGGIADYSGSLVLQRPIVEATLVALQLTARPVLEIISAGRRPIQLPLDALAPHGVPLGYDVAAALFPPGADDHWGAYVAGLFIVLMRERGVAFSSGATIVIESNVPDGKGVSSSAALETAAMSAVSRAFGVSLTPYELALLCQKAENLVAGAPCGVMDQMACVFGEPESLMALLCQPAELQPPVRIPADISFWGLDSGERHAVGGSDYTSVRTGAFMGHRIIAQRMGAPADYLANIPRPDFERELRRYLPEEMSGGDFLAHYGATADSVTVVEPARTYRVRQPTAHPVYEHERVKKFRELLMAPASEDRRIQLGALMYQSHASYAACGLDAPGTTLLVDLVRAEGAAAGLYGARITGGGSGGTVAVIGRHDALPALARVADAYKASTGYRPYVFTGSSPGVASCDALEVTL